MTFLINGNSESAFAASLQLCPIITAWTSLSIWEAAVLALSVNGFNSLLLCYAINKTDIILP